MSLFRDRSFIAAGLGHFAVDMLNSQRPLLVALLSVSLGLSNTVIGLIGTVYTLANSLAQPAFGWAADKFGGRWIAAGGVLWMSGMFALAVLTPGHLSLVFLVMGAFGSSAFHPAGAMETTLRGREQAVRSETTAASLFFFLGQSGFSIGPAIGGPILEMWGMPGLLLLLVFVIPVGLNLSFQIDPHKPMAAVSPVEADPVPAIRVSRGYLTALILLIAFRSWVQLNMMTFLPKYFSDLGLSPGVYGPLAALFIAGGAVGGVVGGWLGDRVGTRPVLFWSMLLASIPLALFPSLGPTQWAYLVTPLSGALNGASQSITFVLAQRMMPSRMGAASGLIMGFTFASGALGTLLSGFQADLAGFDAVFLTTSGFAVVGALMSLMLRDGASGPPGAVQTPTIVPH